MRARAAVIELRQWAAVVRMAEHRAGGEELIERERAVEDVAVGEAELALEVERRKALDREHARAEAGCVALDRVDHQVADRFAILVPRLALRNATPHPLP